MPRSSSTSGSAAACTSGAKEGEEAEWADVLAWEPHERFLVRWRVNPERGPTELEIRFTAEGAKTRVDLEHRGWDDPEGRANYHGPGWDFVLGCRQSFSSK